MKQRRIRKMEYNDVLNNLIEVAAEHMGMTEDIMYKTCVQFFTDGYDSAAQALEKFIKLEFDFFIEGVWGPHLLSDCQPGHTRETSG